MIPIIITFVMVFLSIFALFSIVMGIRLRKNRRSQMGYGAAYIHRLDLMEKGRPSNPIHVSNFIQKLESGAINVKNEFKELEKIETNLIAVKKSKDHAISHRELNRYNNILPYDDTRVILSNNEYINASWIKIPETEHQFIAAQGPLKHTVDHFWKMIYENKVQMVVMLTKLSEKSKTKDGESPTMVVKCEQYWPKQGKKVMGELTVELLEETGNTQLPQLVERKFRVYKKNSESSGINVLQLHYMGWPDHGAPTSPRKLLSLHSIMRAKAIDLADGTQKVVILVHCSAGVGRTGTLLALDIIAKDIDDGNETVDVMNVIFVMRQNRCKMVQQPIQYKYLYNCIAAYIKENVDPGTIPSPVNGCDDVEEKYIYT